MARKLRKAGSTSNYLDIREGQTFQTLHPCRPQAQSRRARLLRRGCEGITGRARSLGSGREKTPQFREKTLPNIRHRHMARKLHKEGSMNNDLDIRAGKREQVCSRGGRSSIDSGRLGTMSYEKE